MIGTTLSLGEVKRRANMGRTSDVDYMMGHLSGSAPLVVCKLVDYGLGLIDSREGRGRIQYYLFQGTELQRNYAALYFKRRSAVELLDEAVQAGCIDSTQAHAR